MCGSQQGGIRMKYALTVSTAMRKVTLVATATALVAAPAFAQESKMTLGEGEVVLVGPDGTMHKSNTTILDAHHRAALAKGANEISNGTAFYRYGGKLYNVRPDGAFGSLPRHGVAWRRGRDQIGARSRRLSVHFRCLSFPKSKSAPSDHATPPT